MENWRDHEILVSCLCSEGCIQIMDLFKELSGLVHWSDTENRWEWESTRLLMRSQSTWRVLIQWVLKRYEKDLNLRVKSLWLNSMGIEMDASQSQPKVKSHWLDSIEMWRDAQSELWRFWRFRVYSEDWTVTQRNDNLGLNYFENWIWLFPGIQDYADRLVKCLTIMRYGFEGETSRWRRLSINRV